MTQSKRQTLGAIGLKLGLVALMLILILTALHAVGTNDALYFKLQTEAGILPEAGVSEEESVDRPPPVGLPAGRQRRAGG